MTDDWRGIPEEYRNQIVAGDARELAKRIPDGSVDLIFTDPPWDDASMPLYSWLAETAMRVLKSDGFVLTYTGNDWLPEIMGYFERAGLHWFRMFSGVQLNSDDRYFRKKLFVKWRPIVVYSSSGATPAQWLPDADKTNRDKRYHQWGQGEQPIIRWIRGLSKIDSIVLDPFAGGGTVPAVCKILGRHYIAFEIDPATAEIARKRVQETQPPLFVPIEQQLDLLTEGL